MKRTTSQAPRLSPLRSSLQLVHGIDRLDLNLDTACLPASIYALESRKFEIVTPDVPYHPHWQTRIHLHQPSTELLVKLDSLLRGCVQYEIYEVEVAADYMPPRPMMAPAALEFFLASAHPRFGRTPVSKQGKTIYFKPRANAEGQKNEGVDAAYADRPSKLDAARDFPGRRAMHFERRLSGKKDLEGAGIITLIDSAALDCKALLDNELVLVRTPSMTEIGRWRAAASAKSMTHVEFQRLGQAWVDEQAVDGHFCMRNCWIAAGKDPFFRDLPRYDGLAELYADFERQARRKAQRDRKALGY